MTVTLGLGTDSMNLCGWPLSIEACTAINPLLAHVSLGLLPFTSVVSDVLGG